MIRLFGTSGYLKCLENYLEDNLESYLELGQSGYASFDGFGGLDNVELVSDDQYLYALVHGRKIHVLRSSKIFDGEAYVKNTMACEYDAVYRKLPENLVERCIDAEIYPAYNYVRPDRMLNWLFDKIIHHSIWEKYTDAEKSLMGVNRNTSSVVYKFNVLYGGNRKDCYIILNWLRKIE